MIIVAVVESVGGLIKRVAELLLRSRHAIALTGAGISTESGIPDFRGPDGLWRKIDPKIATYTFFKEKPAEFWKFHLEFVRIKRAEPNPAHYALAELERMGLIKCVITQNVDGLHQKAGSRNVIELHGNLEWVICLSCGMRYGTDEVIAMIERRGLPPRCERCGGILKPDVVLFEEPLKRDVLASAFSQAHSSDLILALGTSLVVYPAAYLPDIVKSRGGKVVIINMEPTEKDYLADIVVRAKLGEALPMLVKFVRELRGG